MSEEKKVEQDERGAFEAAWSKVYDTGDFLLRHYSITEQYVNHDTQRAWEGWKLRAASTSANVGKLDPRDALRYMACRESAIERGLFATPEEYDAMVDDSLRKNGKEVLTGRGHNYGKKVAKDGSLYRPTDDAARAASTSANVAQGAENTDDIAVDSFARAMKEKMAAARAKGRSGWEGCEPADLSRMLREHIEKGDPRDVANFCMMLWHHSAPIAPPAQTALTDAAIEAGWHQMFSTNNPYCPCNLKSFTKAVQWAERALAAAQSGVKS